MVKKKSIYVNNKRPSINYCLAALMLKKSKKTFLIHYFYNVRVTQIKENLLCINKKKIFFIVII